MSQYKLLWICIVLITSACGGETDTPASSVSIQQKSDKYKNQVSINQSIGEKLLDEIAPISEALSSRSNIIDTLFESIHSSVNDGFALMCKFESGNKKVLKTYVFDRNSEGELIQMNSFDGILLGKDTLVSDYPKIMLRFVEIYGKGDRYYYNCWFDFDRNIDKYVFDHCVSINKSGEDRSYLDVYFSEVESIEDQLTTNREVLSILEKNNYLN